MQPPLERRGAPLAALATLGALAAVAVLLTWRLAAIGMPIDDAYISFRYAQNFGAGHGLIYNLGERVEGYTCFLWVALLGLAYRLGGEIEAWSRIFGVAGFVASGWLTYAIARRVAAVGRAAALIGAAIVFFDVGFLYWSIAGMETTLFAFLVTLALWLYVADAPALLCGAVFGLAALTRPEAPAYMGGLGLGILLVRPQQWRRVRDMAVGFVAVFTPFLLWRWSYYGYPLPNTYYNKMGGELVGRLGRGLLYTWKGQNVSWFALLALGLVPLATPQRARLFPLYGLIAAVIAGVLYEGGDVFGFGRFYVPVLPAIAVVGAAGLHSLWPQQAGQRSRMRVALVGALVVFLLAGKASGNSRPPLLIKALKATQAFYQRQAQRAERVRELTRPGDVIATVAIGVLGYRSGLTTIDMVGLTDETVAHTAVPGVGVGLPGHERFNSAYVLSRRPSFIFMEEPEEPSNTGQSKKAVHLVGSTAPYSPVLAVRDMWFNATFRRDYEWVGFAYKRRGE